MSDERQALRWHGRDARATSNCNCINLRQSAPHLWLLLPAKPQAEGGGNPYFCLLTTDYSPLLNLLLGEGEADGEVAGVGVGGELFDAFV